MASKGAKTTLFLGVFAPVLILCYFPSAILPQASNYLQSQYQSALRFLGEEEYEKAILELQKIIRENPHFLKAYRNLVEAYLFLNEVIEAQTYFENLLKENPQNAYAFYALAQIDFARKEYDKAISKLKKAIELDPKFVEPYSHYGGLPEVYKAKNDLDSAIQFFRELIQSHPNNPCAYYGLARSYIGKYDWEKALSMLTKAIDLEPEFTLAYQSMIYIYSRTSRNDKVLAYSEDLLKIAKKTDDFEMLSYSTMLIGNTYFHQGDYLKSLYYFNEALKSAKAIGAKRIEGNRLNNMAAVYAMSGNFPKALTYFKEALQLIRKSGTELSEVRTLANIGNVYKDQGDYQQALKYYQEALENAKKYKYKDEESLALTNMAEIYRQIGDYKQAIAYQNHALRIARAIENKSREGFVLRNLGRLHQDLGNESAAALCYRQALEMGKKSKDAQIIWESYAGLGASLETQGNPEEAITYYARAIALYDSVRESLDIESLRSNFLEDKYEAYPSIVQLLAQNGKYEEAFSYAEKYKAKTILDILSQGRNLLSELLSDTLQAQLQEITSQQEATHAQLSMETSKVDKDKRKILSLDQQITDLELKKAAIIEDLKNKHRAYYRLTSPEILKVDEIQHKILGREQALLEYVLGPEDLSVFVVTSDTLFYTQMAVSRERLRIMLADLSPIFGFQKSADAQNSEKIFNPQLADFTIPPAYALYEILLKPIEPWIQNAKDLIIVPDDFLYYLPFEMLVFDSSGVETPYDFENARFLMEKYGISYVSSASLLNPGLQRTRKSERGVLALGNPDFGTQTEVPQLTEFLAPEILYSGGVLRGGRLVSLPKSESEVKLIDKVFGSATNTIFIGNQATEANFKGKAKDYTIIHLATHFLTNDNQPLYSKIALAQENKGKEDGYLQTYEVFNINLNADLVVLSACNTGTGKLRRGEGLIGISRAFLFAGVPSLVVSLWSVDDESTSLIMKNFYQNLKLGLNKSQALRLAKIDYLKSSQSYRKDPFYWAPFILIGDWKPVRLPTRPALYKWIIVILILFMGIPAAFIFKNRRHSTHQRK